MSDDKAKAEAAVSRLISTVSSIQQAVVAFSKQYDDQFRATVTAAAKQIEPFMLAAQAAAKSYHAAFAPVAVHYAKIEQLKKAGWLPHHTAPLSEIPVRGDVDVSQLMERHYTDHWSHIKETLLTGIAKYDIDDEAKETYIEAVHAHERGLYRATCRTLFPEIERVVRKDLLGGALDGIASVKELQNVAGELGLSELATDGLSGLELYSRLVDHMYVPAKTKKEVSKLAEDGVPNRHAAMHGLVTYKTFRNSINMLIMADFMFAVVSATKANRRTPSAS